MDRKLFIQACFSDDLQLFYQEVLSKTPSYRQLFDVLPNGVLLHKYWLPSNKCCESGDILNIENIDVKIGYWTPFVWKPIRKDLKLETMKNEAYECQKIDCSCNDCKYLFRELSLCVKKQVKVHVHANLCQVENLDCFEHRRA